MLAGNILFGRNAPIRRRITPDRIVNFGPRHAAAEHSDRRTPERSGNVQQHGDDDTPDLSRILPVLKTTAWQQASQAQLARSNAPTDQRPVVGALAGSLVLAYVEDMPEQMRYITPKRLEHIGMDLAALHATALENLTALLPQLDVQGGGGRYAARLDHNYDASMVLVFGKWRDRASVAGDPVFAVAARDELLVCGSEDHESVAALRDMAQEIAVKSAYGLADELFVWREGRLQALGGAN